MVRKTKKCFYCGISVEALSKVKDVMNNGTHRLTIDRLDNSRGYELNNIVLACLRCNSIKTDFFTTEEMKGIAIKYVKPKWDIQLKK